LLRDYRPAWRVRSVEAVATEESVSDDL
jgi:hypothetical protein